MPSLSRTRPDCAACTQEQHVDVVAGRRCHTGRMTDTSGHVMLEFIAAVLIILWGLGLATSTTMGGLIHVLLVIAIVVVLLRVIGGRKVV